MEFSTRVQNLSHFMIEAIEQNQIHSTGLDFLFEWRVCGVRRMNRSKSDSDSTPKM